jgi:crotonobetainyl-CoA:carnitine CoA-transferase CaiB-like acyl-CoA transferase
LFGSPNELLMTHSAPLEGLVVLDFAQVLAGPLCGQWLAEFGAEVIKVEPLSGDESRSWPPLQHGGGTIFLATNRGKRSLAIDLKSARGREAVARLVGCADVVLHNFPPDVAARLGLDYGTLREINPKLIYCWLTGFGQGGPLDGARAYDPILQAFCGMMTLAGEEGGGPVKMPFAPIDTATAQNAFSGVLLALLQRGQTGLGSNVETCLLDSAIGLMALNFQNLWATGREPGKISVKSRARVPYEVFDTADGQMMIGAGTEKIWSKLCHAIGIESVANEPSFRTNDDRIKNYDEVIDFVGSVMRKRTSAQWESVLTVAGVPNAILHSLGQCLTHPQTASRDMIFHTPNSAYGDVGGVLPAIKLNERRCEQTSPPPRLGADTRSVLFKAGFSQSQIDLLIQEGVVAEPREQLPAAMASES